MWRETGLASGYETLVRRLGVALYLAVQHFPVLERLDTAAVRGLDAPVILTVSLCAVSWRLAWPSRVRRFATALVAVYLLQVVSVFLDLEVRITQELLARRELLVLLPLEFRIVERVKYLFCDVGVEWGAFVLLGLAAWWNASASALPRPRSRARRVTFGRLVGLAGCGLVVVFGTAAGWRAWRESHVLHVAAHARLGRILAERGALGPAEEQYRSAVAGGTSDPQVYLELAVLAARRGERHEAARLLDRALELAPDPAWRQRLRDALAQVERR